MKAIKVRELNKYIKKYIAMDYLMANVDVEGEISNLTKHSNGNYYFTLKDDSSTLKSIVHYIDADTIEYDPVEGDSVIASGAISVFEKDASITFFIRKMKPNGMGNVKEAYEKLKEKLEKEGLFLKPKKRLKSFPEKVGVVTSPTGAAIQDIINVLNRRNPAVDIILYPALVQGEGSVESIFNGLKYFENSDVDVVIVGRGGGAYEDLVAFNDEKLARFIYSMDKIVISAVGHEVDFVITDFVSDLRAPTPSAAAELVSMSNDEIKQHLDLKFNNLNNLVYSKIQNEKKDLIVQKNFFYFNLINKIQNEKKDIIYFKRLLNYSIPKIESHKEIFKNFLISLKNREEKIFHYKKSELAISKKFLKPFNLSDNIKTLTSMGHRLKEINLKRDLYNEFVKLRELKALKDDSFLFQIENRKESLRNLNINTKLKAIESSLNINKNFIIKSVDQLNMKVEIGLNERRNRLLTNEQKLRAVKFSDVYLKDNNGKIITSINQISKTQLLDIYFKDGRIRSKVIEKEER